MFDKFYRQKYDHLQYQINIDRFTVKYILIVYLFNVDADIFFYIFGQT
jgi:hypothetical protein